MGKQDKINSGKQILLHWWWLTFIKSVITLYFVSFITKDIKWKYNPLSLNEAPISNILITCLNPQYYLLRTTIQLNSPRGFLSTPTLHDNRNFNLARWKHHTTEPMIIHHQNSRQVWRSFSPVLLFLPYFRGNSCSRDCNGKSKQINKRLFPLLFGSAFCSQSLPDCSRQFEG